MNRIKRPTFLIDKEKCLSNIACMAGKARKHGLIFRPHFKTHQSAQVGEWFREAGVDRIAVSSVRMAEFFGSHGWQDITIAFPANILETDEINRLAGRIKLNLLLESDATMAFLSGRLQNPAGFFIKIDTGYHRTGIDPANTILTDKILEVAATSPLLAFRGFLTHSGQAYHARDVAELEQIQSRAALLMDGLRKKYRQAYPELILSYGDTPSCSRLDPPAAFDEMRPGNFVYYDLMQFALGSCTLDKVAAAVVCPVVAVHPSRGQAVIYGGSVHLSKELTFLPPDPDPVFGLAFPFDGRRWDISRCLGKVSALSQEHGVILLTQAGCNLRPGDLTAILPVHSCLSAHAMAADTTVNL
jgi:D-serine deaminase-like pyridoxal phosphate-dependent protein